MKVVHCLNCKRRTVVNEKQKAHSWSKGHCAECHYLGLRKRVRSARHDKRIGTNRWQEKPLEKYSVKVTNQNIDLYCKLSKIIRGKPCRNKKLVLSRQQYDVYP